MKLNKKGKPYVEPDKPVPCRVVDKQGGIYHATNAPAGFCKCGIMLEVSTYSSDYVFPSRIKASHAREHTIRYLSQIGFDVDPSDYIIEVVK